jgi:hypothetical protein
MKTTKSKSGTINESFFSDYNADMAYILGLLFSDGYLSSPKNRKKFIGLKLIDLQILEDIKRKMGMSNGIYNAGTTSSGNKLYKIEIGNEKVVSDIEKLGMHARKTFTIKFPKMLPREYVRDFIRGYFDGDGCIHISKSKTKINSFIKSFSILGIKDILDGIAENLPCESKIHKYKKIFRLTVGKIEDLHKIYEFLYSNMNNNLCLLRKKTHFEYTLKTVAESKILQESHIKYFHPRLSKEEYIKKAKEVHGDKYDYSKSEFVNQDVPILIICKEHGEFYQIPNKHFAGHGCQKCSGSYMDLKYFIEKSRVLHGDKYNYDQVNYVNNKTKIVIVCSKHGSFDQIPSNHLLGRGCRLCGAEERSIKMRKPRTPRTA